MKLSIITINLNNASGLRKTIESVVNQTFRDFEYLVIDGGSTDGSVEIIKEFSDKITYWLSEPDNGIYNAMNKGILKAHGEYLQFLNSGDWLVDSSTIYQIFIENQVADILYGDLIQCYHDEEQKNISYKGVKINLQFLYFSSLAHPSSFIKRKLFEQKLYDESLMIVSDWKFFFEKIVLESCGLNYLDIPVAYFNMYGLSERTDMKEIMKQERQMVLNDLFPPLVLSALNELHHLSGMKPVAHIVEIQKYKGLRTVVFGFIRIALRGYQKIRGIKYR
jgi:glycosyltransferase involved in cell wall biosynthesis